MIPKEFKTPSERKQKLIDEFYNKPFEIGEMVIVPQELLMTHGAKKGETIDATIRAIDNDKQTLDVVQGDGSVTGSYKGIISFDEVVKRNEFDIGANPFTHSHSNLRFVAYSLDSILFILDVFNNRTNDYDFNGVPIKEVNWNPYVYMKNGEKEYYQRPFVWSVKEKQLLIDSIYNDIDLGKVVVRKRGWKELERMEANGETELAFNDIVDGKQRIGALRDFILNRFKDSYGNFFSDLSSKAQHQLTGNQLLSYAEMPEESKDKDVLEQFLKVNFAGIPQSKGHINFVRNLHNEI